MITILVRTDASAPDWQLFTDDADFIGRLARKRIVADEIGAGSAAARLDAYQVLIRRPHPPAPPAPTPAPANDAKVIDAWSRFVALLAVAPDATADVGQQVDADADADADATRVQP